MGVLYVHIYMNLSVQVDAQALQEVINNITSADMLMLLEYV